ncbi:MAG: hypothetical protein RMM98_18150 [Acidobacteriota bacterium]|nr:hypothetical protein [Blastocatellia bacterium]MDW8241528.1 hypothetical protein [Acidobacteriota bacterium]
MSDQNQIQPPTNAAGPDLPKLVEQFLENQRQELALRQQQLELNKTHLEKSAEYAHEALKAEFSDRDKERAHQLKILQSVQRFIGVLILAVLIFLFIVFRIDKEAAA